MNKAKTAAEDIKTQSGSDKIEVRKLDLNSLASVRQFAEETIAKEDRLDVLLNNAGRSKLEDDKKGASNQDEVLGRFNDNCWMLITL